MARFDDEIESIMADFPDPDQRDVACLRNHRDLALYFIREGFKAYEAKLRRTARTKFKDEVIKPEFMAETYAPPEPIVTVDTSEKSATAYMKKATEMFIGWKIGKLEIGSANKEKLLVEARNERNAGRGHVINARIYERLAQPMNSINTVAEHWKTIEAVKLIRDEIIRSVRDEPVWFPDEHAPSPV